MITSNFERTIMRRRHLLCIQCVVLVWLVQIAGAHVEIVDLGMPPGSWNKVEFVNVNNAGLVRMVVRGSGIGIGVWMRSPDGTFFKPPPPPGFSGFDINAMNDRGDLVGNLASAEGYRAAVLRHDGTWWLLLPATRSTGLGINNFGAIVGFDTSTSPRRRFVVHPDTGLTYFSVPAGTSGGDPVLLIGGGGTAVAMTGLAAKVRAFKFDSAGGSVLLPIPLGQGSEPTAINDEDIIVGWVGSGSAAPRAAKWLPDNTLVELEPISGFDFAYSINNGGDIVGGATFRAAIWSDDFGARDLNTLLSAQQRQQWELITAFDINDLRRVVGRGWYDPDGPQGPAPREMRAFEMNLSAMPEPPLAGICLAILLLFRRAAGRRLPLSS